MMRQFLILGILVFLVAESFGQRPHIIYPTYRPPPQRPVIIRTAREARDDRPLWLYKGDDIERAPATGDHPYLPSTIDDIRMDPNRRYVRSADDEPLWLYKDDNIDRAPATGDHPYLPSTIDDIRMDPNRRYARSADDEPLWLYKDDNIDRAPATGDHPYLPKYIDDIKLDPNRRYARSLDSPSAKRGGGSHTTSSGSRNTGATHPGYNRRNTRELRFSEPIKCPVPEYRLFPFPPPFNPTPRPFNRVARDVQFPGIKKPSHRDIIIPNWNPNVRTQPWQHLGVKTRRSVETAQVVDG